jgi:hypothetical protein
VNAPTLIDAADAFESQGVPDLLPLLHNACSLVSILVSSLSDSTFIMRPINTVGTSSDTGQLLPLFNSVKVFLVDESNGRPDYKYLKGYLTEGSQDDGVIGATPISVIETAILALAADMNTASAPLVSIDNDQYVGTTVQAEVQMRQMHRKRRKTVAP